MKKESGEMIENRKVNSARQKGIERVLQKKEMPKGQPGKMSGKPKEKAKWRRGDAMTPRGA